MIYSVDDAEESIKPEKLKFKRNADEEKVIASLFTLDFDVDPVSLNILYFIAFYHFTYSFMLLSPWPYI